MCEFYRMYVFPQELDVDSLDSILAILVVEEQSIPLNYDFVE
jgi:hypothetical protein